MAMLETNAWAKVPGTSDVYLYPIVRKPSVTCSSTFILKTSRMVIIIDPGGDPSQIKQIRQVVTPALREREVPVHIFFTHCHVDHFMALSPLLDEEIKGQLIVHELTAQALEENDEQITMADMLDVVLPMCEVQTLFFETDPPYRAPEETAGAHPFPLNNSQIETSSGRYVLTQSFPVSENDVMTIFHTPGHSPDGVSYKIGSFLFTGDLHLATTPGIAGLMGWDYEALAVSLEALIRQGKIDNLELVMPGHGVPFSFEKAEKIFSSTSREALALTNLITLDKARADYLGEYALVLLEEAGILFSTVAARLLKVSHYLEILAEEKMAGEVLRSIDLEAIDRIVDEFYHYSVELRRGGIPLVTKAVQFSRRVEKVFAPEKVSHLFDGFLLRRLTGLLSDFINAVYGVRFRDQDTLFDVNLAVSALLVALKENPHESESIFDSLEDDERFLEELTKRLSFEPLFSRIRIHFEPGRPIMMVRADRTIFQDMVCALLEQFALSGAEAVTLRTEIEAERATLTLFEETAGSLALRDSKKSYLQHSMKMAGGAFFMTTAGGFTYYYFQLPLAATLEDRS